MTRPPPPFAEAPGASADELSGADQRRNFTSFVSTCSRLSERAIGSNTVDVKTATRFRWRRFRQTSASTGSSPPS